MNRKSKIASIVLVLLLGGILLISFIKPNKMSSSEFTQIHDGFKNPTAENTLWCYWYWLNDDISKDGITKDLEAMKKAGIGSALIGNINLTRKDGKVPMLSEAWWSHMVHAVNEGKRLGVDIGIFNCPGWSQSGGPWVDYTKTMRYLTYSETTVQGNQTLQLQLKQPKDKFQDTHTLAFKTSSAEKRDLRTLPAKVTSSLKDADLKSLLDGDVETGIEFTEKTPQTIHFELNENITARHISISPSTPTKCKGKLYALIDGEEKLITSFVFDRSNFDATVGPIQKGAFALSLPNVQSNQFKLELSNFSAIRGGKVFGFSEINISEAPILEKYIEKQLGKMHPTPAPSWNSFVWNTQKNVPSNEFLLDAETVLDLSDKLDENGLLTWDAPEGEWTIMRIGMTPTGVKNAPAAPQGVGYEIDKMNSELAQFHFDNFVGEFLKRIPEDSKSAFKYVVADSYEMGSQNWTDGYEVKFKNKFGYNPVKYLPVLSGRIVGSVEESERFLWDLRRSVADDIAYEYVGGLRKASNEHNLKTWLENYGHWGFPSEFMMYGGQSDLIAGEFWNEGNLGNIECKAASSTAHTYGKGRTSAEAFTSSRRSYLRHPAELKKRGDWSLTEGINHFVLHLYVQQPDDERVPGMNAWFNTEFNRHNTWFEQGKTYFDYLRRCQHLLQQGMYVADVCYFIGESAPIMTGGRDPEIPKGYSYDYINAEVILDRLAVKNGRFVLPDGMTYRVMVLPSLTTMRPEVILKLEQLVAEGGVILGHKPQKSPSLQNYPQCDAQVNEIATKLWGGVYENGKMNHRYGEGYVLDGLDLTETFSILGVLKDVDLPEEAPVLWTHRTMRGMDIYFMSNQSDEEVKIEPIFRVNKDFKPQLWDAVTGDVRVLNDFTVIEGEMGTSVPLTLKGHQSGFIVFTNASNSDLNPAYQSNFPEATVLQELNNPFTVDFANKEIGPNEAVVFNELEDWALSSDDKIKYYSGAATYKTTFTVNELPESGDLFLNLGKVSVMAQATLNGQNLGGVWIAPYLLNVSGILQKGENTLEIEVVNLWRNRLIKDKMLPEAERYTWTATEDIKEDEKPHSSGLLGPVFIEFKK